MALGRRVYQALIAGGPLLSVPGICVSIVSKEFFVANPLSNALADQKFGRATKS
jgi:hypothetical protein